MIRPTRRVRTADLFRPAHLLRNAELFRKASWVPALWLMTAASTVASAQAQAPRPAGQPERPTLMIVATAALLGIMLIGAAFLPSKRGHQD